MIDIDIKLKLKKEAMQFSFNCNSKRTVVFGPSGSGKTTLLKAIAGFYKPLNGKIIINDRIFFDSEKSINLPVYKRKLGYLPQEYTLFPNMSVRDNILYGVLDKKNEIMQEKLEFITGKLQISHKLNFNPQLLSGGQQKRAALARIFMINPEILILDEPFAALDTPVKECLKGIVLEISEEMNIPVLFVSHVLEDSFSLGEGIIIINNGKVVEFGNIDKVYRKPIYAETARLMDFKNIWTIDKIKSTKCTVRSISNSKKIVLNVNSSVFEKDGSICITRPSSFLELKLSIPYMLHRCS
jgi:molybdate transport system ATP-binding protein